MSKQFKIPHDEIGNPKTITARISRAFKENGLDIHKNEVDKVEDDFKTGERIIEAKTDRCFFAVGDVPWHQKDKK